MITKGLVLDLSFSESNTSRFKDNVTGVYGIWNNSPIIGTNSRYGQYVELNGSNEDGVMQLIGRQQKLNQVSFQIIHQADSVSQYKRVLHIGVSGDRTHTIEFDDGWGYIFNANWSGGGGVWSIPKPTVGDIDNFIWTYDWGSTSNDPIIYKNGISQTITERSGPSGTANNDYTRLTLGSELSGGQYWDGKVWLVRMWNRVLTPGEVTILTNNPYVIYGGRTPFMQIGNAAAAVASTVKHYLTTLGVGS